MRKNFNFAKLIAGACLVAVAAIGAAQTTITGLTIDGDVMIGGTSVTRNVTVTLNKTVTPSNATVNITAGPGIVAPASTTVNGNQVSKVFQITAPALQTTDIASSVSVQLSTGGTTFQVPVTIKNLFAKSIGWGKSMVQGQSYIGQVNLNAITAADRTITLSSSNAGVTVPSSVQVLAGTKQAFFNITVDEAAAGSVTIDATFNGSTVGRTQMVKTLMVSSIALDNTVVTGGDPVVGTVTLNTVVSVDTVVNLTSQNAGVATVPATVTILAGNNSATFDITTFVQLSTKSSKITASSFNNSRAVRLYVNPITP